MNYEAGQKAFTLIEIIVVMGILAMSGALGYLVTIDFYNSYVFNAERDTVVSLLEKARAGAMFNINQLPHGVFFDNGHGRYVVFEGVNFSSRNPARDAVVPYAPGITRAGLTEVIFEQLTGDAKDEDGNPLSGSLTLAQGHRSEAVVLNNLGRIDW
ncbi:MAG: prepilin-type N-terminal cleavage/methylation domain-containing protein [Candidatus Doudnabacteria bacterium]|nr:prepilin-type N-terminal cleavage/methylation domain-containing protein [Candidatus Doudnabacteria bacterium]